MTPDPLAEALHKAVHEVEEVACRPGHAEFFAPHAARLRDAGVEMGLDGSRLTDALNAVRRKHGDLVFNGFVYGETGAAVVREYEALAAAARENKP